MLKHTIIIAGGRDFDNQEFINSKLDHILRKLKKDNIEIVEGGARGVDKCGREYAISRNIPYKTFPADWENNGKAAGPIRNREMAEYANKLVAFWDGKSRGTNNMIEELINEHPGIQRAGVQDNINNALGEIMRAYQKVGEADYYENEEDYNGNQ